MEIYQTNPTSLEYELDYVTYANCKFLLERDHYTRRLASAFGDEALSTISTLSYGGVAAPAADLEDLQAMIAQHAREIMDEMFCAGIAIVLFKDSTRKRKRDSVRERDVKVATEGLGKWLRLWIKTSTRSNQRKYALKRRNKAGSYEPMRSTDYVVIDGFGSPPSHDGRLRSVISRLVEPARFWMQMRQWEEHATYNMAHPAIVTETGPGAFGLPTLDDLTGRHAGWSAAAATREIGEEGSLAIY